MAQELKSINLVAPAFKGINTEDSPLAQDPSFAEIADNAVIDKRGRIAARKGHSVITTNKTALGSGTIRALHEFEKSSGSNVVLSAGNNKVFTGTTTLTDATPGGYTITADNWKIVNFNEKAYLFQASHAPLVYDGTSVVTLSSVSGAAGVVQGNEVLAAYGRLWVTGLSTNPSVVYWSDLLIGTDFTGGSSGSIDVSKAWPDGYDEIRALSAHNNLLIIFGKHSILVYQGADSPANMSLADTIAGVGCVCRNSVQHIGTDVLFVAQSGLRSFGRTIQEKSMPLSDLSLNIKTEFVQAIENRTSPTSSAYSPEFSFYLVTFPDSNITYCFDLKTRLDNGAYRVTRWPSSPFTSFERLTDGSLYVGSLEGVGEYAGYSDNNKSYRFRYYSPGLTFGDASTLKILKKLRPTIVGANNATVFINWSYDLSTAYSTQSYTVGSQITGFYNVSEYTEVEYTGGELIGRRVVNTTGSGTIITIGMESDINGFPLSLQEINVLALIGKTI